MNEASILEHLEELVIRLGVELRYENLGQSRVRSNGGYCKVAGKAMIIMNRKDSRRHKICILARALKKLNLDEIFVPPALRSLIELHDN